MTKWYDPAAIRLYLEETSEFELENNHAHPFREDL